MATPRHSSAFRFWFTLFIFPAFVPMFVYFVLTFLTMGEGKLGPDATTLLSYVSQALSLSTIVLIIVAYVNAHWFAARWAPPPAPAFQSPSSPPLSSEDKAVAAIAQVYKARHPRGPDATKPA